MIASLFMALYVDLAFFAGIALGWRLCLMKWNRPRAKDGKFLKKERKC